MGNKENSMTFNFKFKPIALLFSIMILTGCTTAPTQTDNAPVSVTVASVDPSIGQAQTLSLFGAAAALANENPTLAEMLTYSIQDEYLARGEYAYILDAFGIKNPFANIIKAEEKHIAELKAIFEANQVPIPEDKSAEYLIVPSDEKSAFETGVKAEIDNIAMYEGFLKKSLPDDVRAVFVLLRDGSKNHLAAFQRNLDK